jgi:ketosteroid isomerase-like protein
VTSEEFIDSYRNALATQRWASVEPLVHADACVTFSTGDVHRGKEAARAAFEANFSAIQNEVYRIFDVHWVVRSPELAVYVFAFGWTGVINGREAAGSGRGTSVLVVDGAGWKLVAEHLGPQPVSG